MDVQVPPGMGLPLELWWHIISFLELEPSALLSCCRTCQSFQEVAQRLLWPLIRTEMDPPDVDAIDVLVDGVRHASGRAKCITALQMSNTQNVRPVAFSTAPLRLASQLDNLTELNIFAMQDTTCCHPSVWSIYGRAFTHVTHVTFDNIKFPSFVDFFRVIVSFPRLRSLSLQAISCSHYGVPPSISRGPRKKKLDLDILYLASMSEDKRQFVATFIWWFQLKECLARKIHLDDTVALYPIGAVLLKSVSSHLEELTTDFCYDIPRNHKDLHQNWLFFSSMFPGLLLYTIDIYEY